MKTWSPDTCKCHVEEIYSGNTIIGGGVILFKCLAHLGVPDSDLYGVLYSNPDGENKRKNLVIKDLVENFVGKLSETKTNPDGSTYLWFKDTVKADWAFRGVNASRILTITLTGINLTNAEKTAVSTLLAARFGAGNVILEN